MKRKKIKAGLITNENKVKHEPLRVMAPPPLVPHDPGDGEKTIYQRMVAPTEKDAAYFGELIRSLFRSETGEVIHCFVYNRIMNRLYTVETDKALNAERTLGELAGYANLLRDFEQAVATKRLYDARRMAEYEADRERQQEQGDLDQAPRHGPSEV